jgi:phosphoribosylanthranilate isomerase
MEQLAGVTITGADDSTSIPRLVELSQEFPFVEWGILVSQRSEGTPRFPSRDWIDELMAVSHGLKLSMHVCGAWVRQMFVGQLRWQDLPSCFSVVDRIQINTHAQQHTSTSAFIDKLAERKNVQFIFQWDGVNDHLIYAAKACGLNVAALFDTSGGAGILPEKWVAPAEGFPCGYAGGLGPDNVEQQIQKIEAVCNKPFWIDMERRVRSADDSRLDMDAVRNVLERSQKFVNATTPA